MHHRDAHGSWWRSPRSCSIAERTLSSKHTHPRKAPLSTRCRCFLLRANPDSDDRTSRTSAERGLEPAAVGRPPTFVIVTAASRARRRRHHSVAGWSAGSERYLAFAIRLPGRSADLSRSVRYMAANESETPRRALSWRACCGRVSRALIGCGNTG